MNFDIVFALLTAFNLSIIVKNNPSVLSELMSLFGGFFTQMSVVMGHCSGCTRRCSSPRG